MKNLIARFKKAWAAFVRTWKFEKDVGGMTKRVREEVEYAIDCERNSAIKENDYSFLDYAVECYRSALRTYETMAADGHSGMSWSLTHQILNRLMEGKPLKKLNSYDECPKEWASSNIIPDSFGILYNNRYSSHNLAYVKNLRAKEWCSDAVGRALDDALFWNNLAGIYLDAHLKYECAICLSMAEDILEGITGRSDKPPVYIPRGSKVL